MDGHYLKEMQVAGTEDTIRVVIAEDHTLFREGLRLILQPEENIEIVGEAMNGVSAIQVISDLKPDVALLDVFMLEMDGLQVLPVIRKKSPLTKALMLTAARNGGTILKALKAGAKGYLTKSANSPSLISAIKAVHNGELWVERKLMASFFDDDTAAGSLGTEATENNNDDNLTPREHEVIQLLTKGLTNKEIGQALFISEKTVKSHLNSIFHKLNVSRRLQAILYAIKQGIA